MGIFLRNSNWGLRYAGVSSPAGVIRVAVVGTEFWGFFLKRDRRTSVWRKGGNICPLVAILNLPGVKVSSSRGSVMVVQWSRSGGKLHEKLSKRLCLVSLSILQEQGWAQKG